MEHAIDRIWPAIVRLNVAVTGAARLYRAASVLTAGLGGLAGPSGSPRFIRLLRLSIVCLQIINRKLRQRLYADKKRGLVNIEARRMVGGSILWIGSFWGDAKAEE